ncbi:hypothetical protein IAD21_02707 [Abditibacteriota bacterium]|nr:hypothetical protein IAD21_02707 [Abditibacteriota bacterium]
MKFALFSLLVLSGALIQSARATPVPAARADDFVNSIGVCTHWSYYDTPYGNFPHASALLGALGVRHIRDDRIIAREHELFDKYGIKTTAISNPGDVTMQMQSIRDSRDFLDAIEGPNEGDIIAKNSNYKGKIFPEGTRLYQNDLYVAIESDPDTEELRVIAPSVGRPTSNARMAPLSSFDYRVVHSFAGGNKPSDSLESDINNPFRLSAQIQGPDTVLKPIISTVSGYNNALDANVTPGIGQPAIDEATGAKYLPRHFALYFNAGISRTFTYEFLNEFPNETINPEASFGLVYYNFAPKPAYTALKNLISLLSESRWNPTNKTWDNPAPDFSPHALDFDLDGDTKDVRSTLLQKTDGTYYLLLWREVQSFDIRTQEPIENPPAKVVITVPAPAEVSALRISDNQPVTQTPVLSRIFRVGHRKIALDVPDEVVALKITLGPIENPDTTPPGSPQNISAETTGSTAKLSWNPPPDTDVAGFFVSRLGQELGRAEGTTFNEEKLDPQTGYTYTVRSYDKAGNISKPATIVAMTKNEAPDLVVARVALVAGEDALGNDAHFEATIENRGNAPSPAGITHGVSFSMDGEFLAWSDTFQGPLAPGASVTVRSTSGPKGTATWHVVAGKHTIHSRVDDVNRIKESNEDNNTLDAPIEK